LRHKANIYQDLRHPSSSVCGAFRPRAIQAANSIDSHNSLPLKELWHLGAMTENVAWWLHFLLYHNATKEQPP